MVSSVGQNDLFFRDYDGHGNTMAVGNADFPNTGLRAAMTSANPCCSMNL
jgi:hypothetical protein